MNARPDLPNAPATPVASTPRARPQLFGEGTPGGQSPEPGPSLLATLGAAPARAKPRRAMTPLTASLAVSVGVIATVIVLSSRPKVDDTAMRASRQSAGQTVEPPKASTEVKVAPSADASPTTAKATPASVPRASASGGAAIENVVTLAPSTTLSAPAAAASSAAPTVAVAIAAPSSASAAMLPPSAAPENIARASRPVEARATQKLSSIDSDTDLLAAMLPHLQRIQRRCGGLMVQAAADCQARECKDKPSADVCP